MSAHHVGAPELVSVTVTARSGDPVEFLDLFAAVSEIAAQVLGVGFAAGALTFLVQIADGDESSYRNLAALDRREALP